MAEIPTMTDGAGAVFTIITALAGYLFFHQGAVDRMVASAADRFVSSFLGRGVQHAAPTDLAAMRTEWQLNTARHLWVGMVTVAIAWVTGLTWFAPPWALAGRSAELMPVGRRGLVAAALWSAVLVGVLVYQPFKLTSRAALLKWRSFVRFGHRAAGVAVPLVTFAWLSPPSATASIKAVAMPVEDSAEKLTLFFQIERACIAHSYGPGPHSC